MAKAALVSECAAVNPGDVFGRLTVREIIGPVRYDTHAKFVCECGAETVKMLRSVVGGITSSCGCLHREVTGALNLRHGQSGTKQSPTYNSWQSMTQRCRNEKRDHHHRYADRGITVCDRWKIFENFLQDMGERPAGTSLERIDNDGNYAVLGSKLNKEK